MSVCATQWRSNSLQHSQPRSLLRMLATARAPQDAEVDRLAQLTREALLAEPGKVAPPMVPLEEGHDRRGDESRRHSETPNLREGDVARYRDLFHPFVTLPTQLCCLQSVVYHFAIMTHLWLKCFKQMKHLFHDWVRNDPGSLAHHLEPVAALRDKRLVQTHSNPDRAKSID